MYELRSGVSNGFGGTLLAGGEVGDEWEMWRNGFDAHGFLGYTLAADLPDINLPAGEYMLALSPIGDGTGRVFVQTTSGDNALGTPINDYRNWFHSNYFGSIYAENSQQAPGYSYGVGFCYPPAPSALALLGIAALRFAGPASRRRR